MKLSDKIMDYIKANDKLLFNEILYDIDMIDSSIERSIWYVILSKYVDDSIKYDLIDEATNQLLRTPQKLRLYINLYYSTNDKKYLNIIKELTNKALKLKGFNEYLVEALVILDMDTEEDYVSVAFDYLDRYKDNLEIISKKLTFYKFYNYMYEKTNDKSYLKLRNKAEEIIYENDKDKKYKKLFYYDNLRYQKYLRINDFEFYLLASYINGISDNYMYLNAAFGNNNFENFRSAMKSNFYGSFRTKDSCVDPGDPDELDKVYNSLNALVGLEIIYLNRNIHEAVIENPKDKIFYTTEFLDRINGIVNDIIIEDYMFDTLEFSKFYELNNKLEEASNICLDKYYFLSFMILDVIKTYKANDMNLVINKLNIIYKEFELKDKYKWFVEVYEYGFKMMFWYLANYIAIDLWKLNMYDEYLKLLKFIERSKDIIGKNDEDYKEFMAKNIYYNIACYYLKSGEERCDPDMGYEYYLKFKDNYDGNYNKFDLEKDNLHFILSEFLVI